ncbi:MAG: hypothetical protein V2A58_16955 [Planctomycetota bacterium]
MKALLSLRSLIGLFTLLFGVGLFVATATYCDEERGKDLKSSEKGREDTA